MDCAKVGRQIRALRTEKGLTQKQLADRLGLCDQTVSKWERGLGCPDVSLLAELAQQLEIPVEALLRGERPENDFVGGNMKKASYYLCPVCGNLTVCTGSAAVTCCARQLTALTPHPATPEQRLHTEEVEDDWYITGDHPMDKEHYVPFVAFATGDKLLVCKQYPEWTLQARLPRREHGTLLWYTPDEGLLTQRL